MRRRYHRKCHVTILMLRDWPFHTKMVALLIDHINTGVQGVYEPFIVRVDHNEAVIQDFVRQAIFKHKADIIITIGALCSKAAKVVVDTIYSGKPVIFMGVREPLQLKLVKSLEKPEASLTGVVREAPSALTVAHYFSYFAPFVSTVLIPYLESDAYLYNQAVHIKQYLSANGIAVQLASVPADLDQLQVIIHSYAALVQGVILLEGCYTNAVQEQLAYWCWENKIILCGSGPHAMQNGVACALSGDFGPIVAAVYDQLRLFWEYQKPIKDIPVRVLRNNEQFLINVDMLLRVGVPALLIQEVMAHAGVCAERTWTRRPKTL